MKHATPTTTFASVDVEQHELTYRGRVTPSVGSPMGPDTRGRAWKVAAVVYDPATNRTFVTVELTEAAA